MIRFSVPFIALMLAFSGTANAKFIGRWDPAAYAQGKFEIQKTAFVQKEPVVEKIQIESKHILVKVDSGIGNKQIERYKREAIKKQI